MTNIAVADEIAASAELVQGKSAGVPAAIVRGFSYDDSGMTALRRWYETTIPTCSVRETYVA